MAVQRSVRLRRWSLALGVSVAAMGFASSAEAQCAPDPTTSSTTTCSGTEPDGLVITETGARVAVQSGATVQAGTAAAAIETRAFYANFAIDGRVDGAAKPAFLAVNGAPYLAPCDPYAGATPIVCPPGLVTYYPSADATVTVGTGGSLTGAQALVSRRSPGNNTGRITVTLTNAGTVTGTTGTAISDQSEVLGVRNAVGATISGVGTAIDTDGVLRLDNAGTIIGSVTARGQVSNPAVSGGSTVNTLAGEIRGDLTLGAGDDVLEARYEAGRVVTGVTGAVDGGAGIDTLNLRVATDATFATLPLLTRFERLGLVLSDDAAVTLGAAGTMIDGMLAAAGRGTATLAGTLAGAGEVVTVGSFGSDGEPIFVNAGEVRAGAGAVNGYAIRVFGARRFQNDGLVEAAGNGVSFSAQGSFVNTGTITAAGTALDFWGGAFDNSGTIRSTAGTAVTLNGSSSTGRINSGLIEGATVGVALSSDLTNSGTIRSGGTAVQIGFYGVLTNLAGGRIEGDIAPVAGPGSVFNAVVANAGTITGDVRFGNGAQGSSYSSNRYIALPGGVLQGDLTLASGEQLVTEAVNTGSGAFAGIDGTVNASDSLLRYRVRGDLSTAAAARPGFREIGYDLYDGARLTLTGASTPLLLSGNGSVDLTADIAATAAPALSVGSVIVAPGETRPDTQALSITSRGTLTIDRATGGSGAYTAVALDYDASFINAGTIVVRDRAGANFGSIAGISGGKDVTNGGAILLDGGIGVAVNGRFVNSGIITQVAGGRTSTGVSGFSSFTVVNSGTIEVAGRAIDSGSSVTIDNIGRLASTGTVAIGSGNYDTYAAITNRAGGTIAGSGTAIRIAGGTLDNAGTVDGSVDLGASTYGSGRSVVGSTYVARGGTIAGDLRFGDGDDVLIAYDDVTGVSGAVDGGGGTDTFIHARASSSDVAFGGALPSQFEREGALASGAGTVVTLRAAAPIDGGLRLYGDAGFVNTVSFGGTVTTYERDFYSTGGLPSAALASFVNQARIGGGFRGDVAAFTNAGSIAAATSDGVNYNAAAVSLRHLGDLSFSNTGDVTGAEMDGRVAVDIAASSGVASATNEGRLVGGLRAVSGNGYTGLPGDTTPPAPVAAAVTLVNRGTITAQGTHAIDAQAIDSVGAGATLGFTNAGTISATGAGTDAAALRVFANVAADGVAARITAANSGTISANAGGYETSYVDWITGQTINYVVAARAMALAAPTGSSIVVDNAATGVIEATGEFSTALSAGNGALDLTNAGTIRGGAGYTLAGTYHGGAIDTGRGDDRIINTGTIVGAVKTQSGDDRFENAGLMAGDIWLGDGNDTFVVKGGTVLGTIDGGAGDDMVAVTGGSAAAPARLNSISNVERLAMSGGYAQIAGTAVLNAIDLTGGRVVGLAGSTITAYRTSVGAGATFGSAGIVDGDVSVAGTLSPGASPGTMTVNGNVLLATGARALFELAPTLSDRLVVNGALAIQPGVTLEMVPVGALRPGASYRLISASGGISGSFDSVVASSGVPGVILRQSASEIDLLGQFQAVTGAAPQVARSIAYANAALAVQADGGSLLVAVPALLDATGGSRSAAFARLTPEPYAAATQLGIDDALLLGQAARGPGFATGRDEPGAFTFAQTLGQWHTLQGDADAGSATARARSYGFLGGLGFGDRSWSVGVFAGYLNGRQQIDQLSARTRADGVVGGVHARFGEGDGWSVTASLMYDGASARTDRALPGGAGASGRFSLHSWVSDVAAQYDVAVGGDWMLRPRLGVTYVRTTRGGVDEEGGSVFALTVARDRHVAGFADAGLGLARSEASTAPFRPWVALGARYQIEGRRADALAGYSGAGLGLTAVGAGRAAMVGTAAAGVGYRLPSGLELFSTASAQTGADDHQETISAGVRLRF
ncbi:autotransporter outer membrane beta-barrel domain-containing protein [Sphingomonas sp. BK580]|uniref:autotransporter outer membrane beta-barrel domain-containing protein n=1 Tax=Sphingomonas sp. BK580 TaxID=2586972 RepID=UPI0016176003|nr:autotransporter outer membrane beta-barrel domain-containing protein [Sphingomonas sp. BK580]MBB3691992.1 hypothetical protein [Sphingomonas sp. BK580]